MITNQKISVVPQIYSPNEIHCEKVVKWKRSHSTYKVSDERIDPHKVIKNQLDRVCDKIA
jgi:hypothetical protein